MIPFAVAFTNLLRLEAFTGVLYGTIAFIGILLFIATVIIGLVYDYKKGTFDWNVQARAEAKAEARTLRNEKRQRAAEVERAI